MAKVGVFAFIKEHWKAYLVGAAIAVVLGLGLAYFLGVKWSTPEDVRAEHVASERNEDSDSGFNLTGGSVEF